MAGSGAGAGGSDSGAAFGSPARHPDPVRAASPSSPTVDFLWDSLGGDDVDDDYEDDDEGGEGGDREAGAYTRPLFGST